MRTELPISTEELSAICKPIVLIVDDDPGHHRLMGLLADRLGFTAHLVSSCGQAIDSLDLFAFDMILMDYRMPVVDGCTCVGSIREMTAMQRIPIIAVTAHVFEGSREKCLEAGMDDFLEKPFTLEALSQKIHFWLQKNRA